MEQTHAVQKNIELQRQWYGEPLGDRVRRLVVASDVSQAYLADVLGISAPMLSQVMSGRRAKISNPVVLARLITLERKILMRKVSCGDRQAMLQVMDEVRASCPGLRREDVPALGIVDEPALCAMLQEGAQEEDLVRAAEHLQEDFPTIADILRTAGTDE